MRLGDADLLELVRQPLMCPDLPCILQFTISDTLPLLRLTGGTTTPHLLTWLS